MDETQPPLLVLLLLVCREAFLSGSVCRYLHAQLINRIQLNVIFAVIDPELTVADEQTGFSSGSAWASLAIELFRWSLSLIYDQNGLPHERAIFSTLLTIKRDHCPTNEEV